MQHKTKCFIIIIFIFLGYHCTKFSNENTANEDKSSITSLNLRSSAFTDSLGLVISQDSFFIQYVDSYVEVGHLIFTDSSFSDTSDIHNFIYVLMGCGYNIHLIDSTISTNGLKNHSKIMIEIETMFLMDSLVYTNHGLVSCDKAEVENASQTAWYLRTTLAGEDGEESPSECCAQYKRALLRCCSDALDYLAGAWILRAATGNPFEILDEVYACIARADAKFKPCCPS
jgi:hypothetical protein